MIKTRKILDNIKKIKDIDSDVELSNIFNIPKRTLDNWVYRNSFDYLLIIEYCKNNNISLDYVFDNMHVSNNSNTIGSGSNNIQANGSISGGIKNNINSISSNKVEDEVLQALLLAAYSFAKEDEVKMQKLRNYLTQAIPSIM